MNNEKYFKEYKIISNVFAREMTRGEYIRYLNYEVAYVPSKTRLDDKGYLVEFRNNAEIFETWIPIDSFNNSVRRAR